MTIKVRIRKLEHLGDLPLPNYATKHSSGMDLFATNISPIAIKPGETTLISTGISIAIPLGFEAQIRPRSGLAAKHSITVLNSPGTIDADYRGEIKVLLINHGTDNFLVEKGMKIAQMIIARYEQVSWEEVSNLDETSRSDGGFGSTGY